MENTKQKNKTLKKILETFKIEKLFEYQEKSLKEILNGNNVLIISPTGTGKTEASIIPSVLKILNNREKGIKILYITPLRALNRDILKRLKKLEDVTPLKIDIRHGDTRQYQRQKQAKNPPDILITTPETLQCILIGKNIREVLKKVKIVIIDEVHELVDSKRGVQLALGLERLRELIGKDYQRIALSATVGNEDEVAKFFFGTGSNYKIINARFSKEYKIKIVFPSHGGDQIKSIIYIANKIIKTNYKFLIFCNTRAFAETLSYRLSLFLSNKNIGVHHSSLSKDVRIMMEEDLKTGNIRAIVCTSSLELGIDIGSVDEVIQYKSPKQVIRLLQRIGRAGHKFDKTSKGTIIAENFDDIVESSAIIQLSKKNVLEKPEIHYGALDVLAHQIVGLVLEYRRINFNKVYEIIKKCYPYKDLTREEFNNVVEFLKNVKYLFYFDDGNLVKSRKGLFYYFSHISMIPEEVSFTVVDTSKNNKTIGKIDGKFVSDYGIPGQRFIYKGEVWTIVNILDAENKLLVRPSKTREGAIPSWIGEELPVPYEVANFYSKILNNEEDLKYVDDSSKKYFNKFLEHQKKYFIPRYDKIIVEKVKNDRLTIIHSHNGYKINNTLSKLIGAYLSFEKSEPVLYSFDPYRIIVYDDFDLYEIFYYVRKFSKFKKILKTEIERSTIFRWRFLYIARRLGLVRSIRRIKPRLDRIINIYKNSIVYREVLNELFIEKFDLEASHNIIKDCLSGKIKIEVFETENPSPLGELGILKYKIEIQRPRTDKSTDKIIDEILKHYKVILYCPNCENNKIIPLKDLENETLICKCGFEYAILFTDDEDKEIGLERLNKLQKNGINSLIKELKDKIVR